MAAHFKDGVNYSSGGAETAEQLAYDGSRSVKEIIDELAEAVENKVGKEDGKGLSANDYVDEDKAFVTDNRLTNTNGITIENSIEYNSQDDTLSMSMAKTTYTEYKPAFGHILTLYNALIMAVNMIVGKIKTQIEKAYVKPQSGIPLSDMANSIKNSINNFYEGIEDDVVADYDEYDGKIVPLKWDKERSPQDLTADVALHNTALLKAASLLDNLNKEKVDKDDMTWKPIIERATSTQNFQNLDEYREVMLVEITSQGNGLSSAVIQVDLMIGNGNQSLRVGGGMITRMGTTWSISSIPSMGAVSVYAR